MSYSEAIQFLYDLRWFGAKLGLSNTTRLSALAGNPHHKLRCIQVDRVLISEGEIVKRVEEMRGLVAQLTQSTQLTQLTKSPDVSDLHPIGSDVPRPNHPTFFEVVTVMALRHFVEQRCDLVIWE